MAEAVVRHYQLLDAAVTAHDGARPQEQGEGDSVVAAFSRAADAFAARPRRATRVQREVWPTPSPVRCGWPCIGRGPTPAASQQLCRLDNHSRRPRLRDLGRGGQILVSAATGVSRACSSTTTWKPSISVCTTSRAFPRRYGSTNSCIPTFRLRFRSTRPVDSHQPAGGALDLHRPRRRAVRAARPPARQPHADHHRYRRRGQDEPRPQARVGSPRSVTRRRVVAGARAAFGTGPGPGCAGRCARTRASTTPTPHSTRSFAASATITRSSCSTTASISSTPPRA